MRNLIICIIALFATSISNAQVGIGVTNPHASAALEVVAKNNDKGILITRLTKSQRDAISAPATGLLVYQTDNSPGFYFFNGISWAAVGKDDLGNHILTQSLDLNGNIITDNTDYNTQLTIKSLMNDKDISIKSFDEIYLTTVNGSGTSDPNGTSYTTFGDIELDSADDVIVSASTDVDVYAGDDISIEAGGDDVIINAADDVRITSSGKVRMNATETIEGNANQFILFNTSDSSILIDSSSSADATSNIKINSGNDIELITTDGDYVEIWKKNGSNTPEFMYTLPNSRGNVGQFLQRSSDGSTEFYSNWSTYKLPLSDGASGQILTTDGSGTVSWTTPSGGASSLNDLSDVKAYGTGSFTIGHSTTGILDNANYNLGFGIGTNAQITTGDNNVAIGSSALYSTTSGSDNTAVGHDALALNTTGHSNSAMGMRSLTSNSTGYSNSGLGAYSLYSNTIGRYNSAFGYDALRSNSTGDGNTSVGYRAGRGLTTGTYNTAIGYEALKLNTSGSGHTVMGKNALLNLTGGLANVAIGNNAGYMFNATNFSIFIGNGITSFNGISTPAQLGDRNIYIGSTISPSGINVSDEIVLGALATGNGANTITLGHTTNTAVYARGTVYSNGAALTSDRRLKTDIKSVSNGLSALMKLNPVSYKKRLSFDTVEYSIEENGFIAQEVQEILPDLVSVGPDENKTLSLDYNSLIPILTKAIQEQQAIINSLLKRVETLEGKN